MALTNMLVNGKLYTPYLITCVVTVAMYFIVVSMAITDLPGGETMRVLMRLGQVLIALFSGVFLYYTNSFSSVAGKRSWLSTISWAWKSGTFSASCWTRPC